MKKFLLKNKAEIAEIAKKYQIDLVYLFGSSARDQMTKMSDIDLAVLFEKTVPLQNYLKLQFAFVNEVEKKFNLLNLDVRALNTASLRFKFNVYQEGVLIYAKNEDQRILFELGVFQEFNDCRFLYAFEDAVLLKRLISV